MRAPPQPAQTASSPRSQPSAPMPRQSTSSYFGYQGEADEADLRELRRRQAEAHEREEAIDRENRWMLAPVIAPIGFVVANEILGSMAARAMAQRIVAARGVPKRAFEPNRGENPYAAAGRKAHEEFKQRVKAKEGWDADQSVPKQERVLRPDAQTPRRNPENDEERFNIELKPNTPRGRRAGAESKRRYERATKNRTRVIYYDPKDYL
jgi:hypothetical protein